MKFHANSSMLLASTCVRVGSQVYDKPVSTLLIIDSYINTMLTHAYACDLVFSD